MAKGPGVGKRVIGTITGVKGKCSAGHQVGDTFEISCHDPGGLCGFFYHLNRRISDMDKIVMLFFFVISFVAAPAIAEKPEWAAKGKPSPEQKKAHNSAMEAKESIEDDLEEEKEKGGEIKAGKEKQLKKQHDELKGLEKQKVKKSEQIQKELDKGSEKGKEARKKRKKWWKFWGE